MAAAAAEEVAMEGAVAVVVEAVMADIAAQTAPPWVEGVGGKPGTSSPKGFLTHVSRRVSHVSVLLAVRIRVVSLGEVRRTLLPPGFGPL